MFVFGAAWDVLTIDMNMAMQQVARFEDVHQVEKDFEAGVSAILTIMNAEWGRMGDEDI